jgi:hypothetical protein
MEISCVVSAKIPNPRLSGQLLRIAKLFGLSLKLISFVEMLLEAFAPLLLLLYAPLSALSVQLPTSMEVDIIFPREGDRYAVTDPFPVLVAVQNSAAAYDYGFDFSWLINPCSTCNNQTLLIGEGEGDIFVLANSPPPPNNPHIEINSSVSWSRPSGFLSGPSASGRAV